MTIRPVLTLILLATCCGAARAQSGKTTLDQAPEISELLNIYTSVLGQSDYYRIQVGFGNATTAQEIKDNVEIDFPNLPARIDFDSPTYRYVWASSKQNWRRNANSMKCGKNIRTPCSSNQNQKNRPIRSIFLCLKNAIALFGLQGFLDGYLLVGLNNVPFRNIVVILDL